MNMRLVLLKTPDVAYTRRSQQPPALRKPAVGKSITWTTRHKVERRDTRQHCCTHCVGAAACKRIKIFRALFGLA
jgi:hypothetical protein